MKNWKKMLGITGIALPLLLALICAAYVSFGSHQASMSIPMRQTFVGTYSYDGENWLPLTEDADISALKGDLYLKGRFKYVVSEDQFFHFYRNHIGVTMHINGEAVFMDDVMELEGLSKKMFSSVCGQEWSGFAHSGILPGDEVEIRLHNPHSAGNETAYRDFLNTLCCDAVGSNVLAKNLEPYGVPFRIAGGLCAIVSLMLLGAAVTAAVTRISVGGRLLKQSALILFAGGLMIFDTIDSSYWNELVVLNTYGRQLCMMMVAFFIGHIICDSLSAWRKSVAGVGMAVSSVLNAVLILCSMTGITVIFDTMPIWMISQMILCPMLMVFSALELVRADRYNRLMLISGLLMLAGILMDIFGVCSGLVWRNPSFKILFLLLFLVHLVFAARGIVLNQRATLRAERLEKELENNRISIMLSQIQPHFLYNVLGTIRGLCREDPMQARQALEDFSGYLRGNMSALSNSSMIHFTGELRHIEAYLRLEKMRMGGKLNILYDIQERDFFLPPLTIQPLVENAVKHGLFEKGGGTLVLSTGREDDHIVISIQDDGIGFDESAPLQPDDHHAHVGLANVRSRLEKMCGGRMVVQSAPGAGTLIRVLLHADYGRNGDGNLNEHTGH